MNEKNGTKHGMKSDKASEVKKNGHITEQLVNNFFGNEEVDFQCNWTGPSADCTLAPTRVYTRAALNKLNLQIREYTASVKSGTTLQFGLQPFPELTRDYEIGACQKKNGKEATKITYGMSAEEQLGVLKSKSFWQKYFGKGELLVYFTGSAFLIFIMEDAINYIIDNCKWKFLQTGRLKGNFYNSKKSKDQQILTFEYRKDKKKFVLGASGGTNGTRFIELLKLNIKYCEISPEAEGL